MHPIGQVTSSGDAKSLCEFGFRRLPAADCIHGKVRHMRASETAYQLLRDEIIQWKLEPGTPLGEVETSLRLGVSRTPLREALSRLIAEGLVRTGPGRTAVVTSLSRSDIVELFELREALETQSARLAARRREAAVFEALRADFLSGATGTATASTATEDRPYFLADALDVAIDTAADSVYLQGALRDLRGHLARVRRSAHSNTERLGRATTEHILIVDAILAKDEALAASATAVHLHNSLANILASLPEDEE
jgi:GntR family transcriptional regulator, rspAB operon transcriptional repressor